jgi:site-specific DNA-methyltransferase (adenine-specific)
MITLHNNDCLKIYKNIKNSSIDLILCDPPYGTIQNLKLNWRKKIDWDIQIDIDDFFLMANHLLRQNGKMIVFGQEPFTSKLIQNTKYNIEFNYRLIWQKNHFANSWMAKKAPLNLFEDIIVFTKKYDTLYDHPLRLYSKKIHIFINKNIKDINKILGHRKAEHFFYHNTMQFGLCTKEVYQELINVFKINIMPDFISYDDCYKINKKYKSKYKSTYNLPADKKYKSNIFRYNKDKKNMHPTQKPVLLLQDLICTYSNPNDLVLDNCMGSGSTGIAAMNTKRNFIGIEKDTEIFEMAEQRLYDHQQQLNL